ncbi:MAG TPA: lysylphosphatidylglycerol synthase domain-containing protein [Pyrinomonadaceae bacterium]|nr:lysylphosphatidylglycerol synthase domain-containing protein [Pyrinomonadaceae bacterium]
MSIDPNPEIERLEPHPISPKHINRLKIVGLILTLAGIGLFSYLIYSVGGRRILHDIRLFGGAGFALILLIYFLRLFMRALAWKLSVYEPYKLGLRDTIPAVIIGEAMSSLIPLGILMSGTAKAVAVRKRVPLVVGLSSVATENLFYSLITSLFLVAGAFTLLRTFDLDEGWVATIDVVIAVVCVVVCLGIVMVVRQWHIASELCEWLYQRGIGKRILENGRLDVRLFENLIYGFYRRYPQRFIPICLLELSFHILGVFEGWYILSRLLTVVPNFLTAFLLESVSRLITIVFKLVPLVVGVDEAGARFVTKTLAIGAGVGITVALIRKARILFWTAIGILLIIKRGLSIREISQIKASQER